MEMRLREEAKAQRLIKKAKFINNKSLDDYHWGNHIYFPKHLDKDELTSLNFVEHSQNVVLTGSPGTGKTHTAVRILENWAIQDTGTVLAVADSNVAVDNLLEGLLERGIRAVRLGQPVKVRENLREATMDARMESHELNRDLIEEIERNEKLSRRIKGMRGGKEKGLAHRDLSRGWKEVRRLERQIRDDILDRAQVLCCTCIGSGHDLLDGRRFSRVLIDEATQATEPASLVPLVKGSRQIVLVGDHRQLPPTVISRRAEKGGLDRSLFERLVEMGIAPLMVIFGAIYHWFPLITGRFLDEKLGKWHFWTTFLGAYSIYFPMHYLGFIGVPRRYFEMYDSPYVTSAVDMNEFISVAAFIVGAAQFIFFFNVVRSLRLGKRAEKNPWKANSLEWLTPSMPPEHGNFGEKLPVVHRWAYDYNVPGAKKDYITQTTPPSEVLGAEVEKT